MSTITDDLALAMAVHICLCECFYVIVCGSGSKRYSSHMTAQCIFLDGRMVLFMFTYWHRYSYIFIYTQWLQRALCFPDGHFKAAWPYLLWHVLAYVFIHTHIYTVAAASTLLPGWTFQGRMALAALIAGFGGFFAVGCKGFCECLPHQHAAL